MQKVGIICAGDEELAPFLPHIEDVHISEKAMLKLYEGTIGGVPVVALYSGVCKVNAAIATQLLVDVYQVDLVINAGVAGGMDASIQLFDIVISTQAAYHDVAEDILTEFHPWMPSIYFDADPALLKLVKRLCMDDRTLRFGPMVTGEAFIADENRGAINAKYAPLSVDMETASIAHVCYVNKIPFIAIRSITDTAAHSGLENFEQNCQKASAIAKDVTLALLAELAKDC